MTPPHPENPEDAETGQNQSVDSLSTDAPSADTSASNVVSMNAAPRDAELEEARQPDEARTDSQSSPDKVRSGRKGTILLLALLLVSVFFNFLQSQRAQQVSQQTAEVNLALDRAMERIDAETGRANLAEGALSEIDRSVDNVQERITELQSALTILSKTTAKAAPKPLAAESDPSGAPVQ